MSNFLLPVVTLPTKINRIKSSVIDNIFTNHLHPDMKSGNLTVGISDHLPTFFIVPKKIIKIISQKITPFLQEKTKISIAKISFLIICRLTGMKFSTLICMILTIHCKIFSTSLMSFWTNTCH